MLAYHQRSMEVDSAFGLLFLIGSISIIMSFLLDADISLSQAFLSFKAYWNTLQKKVVIQNSDVEEYEIGAISDDDDVILERSIAMSYQPEELLPGQECNPEELLPGQECNVKPNMSVDESNGFQYAVVLQGVHHRFPGSFQQRTPRVALKELSLALRYGEVFGLLGPNGAGNGTLYNFL